MLAGEIKNIFLDTGYFYNIINPNKYYGCRDNIYSEVANGYFNEVTGMIFDYTIFMKNYIENMEF